MKKQLFFKTRNGDIICDTVFFNDYDNEKQVTAKAQKIITHRKNQGYKLIEKI